MFPFDLLSPKRWIESILGFILILALLFIPGWKAIFSEKTMSQAWQIFSSNPFGTIGKAARMSTYYYRGLFQDEAEIRFKQLQEEVKEETIKTLEEKAGTK